MLLQETVDKVSDGTSFHVINLVGLILYIVAKELAIPLMKKRKDTRESKDPIYALKVDLEKVSTQVVDLDKELGITNVAINNKLDIIIQELTEQKQDKKDMQETLGSMRERIASVEAILKKGRR